MNIFGRVTLGALLCCALVFPVAAQTTPPLWNGGGVNSTQFDAIAGTLAGGAAGNCGDGATANQTCFLVPHSGFRALNSVSELNGPRILQGAFTWSF